MMTWPWHRVFQSFLFEPLRLIAQKVVTLFELLTLKRNWRPLNDFTHEMDLRIVKPHTVIKEPYLRLLSWNSKVKCYFTAYIRPLKEAVLRRYFIIRTTENGSVDTTENGS